MDGRIVGAWTVGALAGLGLALYFRRKNASPEDPEERLRELIGPQGMAMRGQNRAAADAKWDVELLASVESSIKSLREKGDAAGAEKLEAYAETVRARRDRR
ncbi:MAG: hypothetical protein HYV14_11540 [Elusimicrobia bacterium]|nr:hypothetical protein [Elusimicrobiota bacterium]